MITVTLKNDDEGFYGSASAEEIARIDHDASVNEFNQRVRASIHKYYPTDQMQVIFDYGPYSGRSIFIVSNDPEEDEDAISDWIQEIVGNVYNDGLFWTEK